MYEVNPGMLKYKLALGTVVGGTLGLLAGGPLSAVAGAALGAEVAGYKEMSNFFYQCANPVKQPSDTVRETERRRRLMHRLEGR